MSRAQHARRAAAVGLLMAIGWSMAGAALAQSCAADGPDATRCRFLLPEARTVHLLARAYLHRAGPHPAADLQISVDGRPCFHRLEHPGFLNGPVVGACTLRLVGAEHWVEARVAPVDANPTGVGVEMTTEEPLMDVYARKRR